MNKLICILLCILLISLSVVSVSAQDYFYTNISDYVNALNSVYGQLSNANVTDYFISSLSSGYSNAFDDLVSYYNIDTTLISFVICSYNSGSYGVRIICSTRPGNAGYVANWSSTTAVPYFYQYFPNGTVVTVYNGSYNGSQTVNMTSSSSQSTGGQYTPLNNSRGWFRGVMPYKTTISPNSNYVDFYYLNSYNVIYVNNGGGGDVNVGDIGDVNWVNFATLFASYLASNYTFTVNGTTYNPSYSNVGWCLAYLFESMENPTLATITLDNSTMDNPVYRLLYGNSTNPTLFNTIATKTTELYAGLSVIGQDLIYLRNDVADLHDIYASDQEIEAREAAEDNQQAIIDNFLDSEGEGYVSPSDISSVSSMSDDYKTHMSTDAQPSGIWDIFNSNNFGWFSQETVNQLDTTTSNQRGSNTFETPYLDEKIKDIYKSLGVNYDD